MSVYEVHLGSWRRGDANRLPTYREVAHPALAEHAQALGFTPDRANAYHGSIRSTARGDIQTTGYFAPTSRYGSPQDFPCISSNYCTSSASSSFSTGCLHNFRPTRKGWLEFDGTHLYEHADPRQGFHPEWNSSIFNYGRNEVRAFLLSSALFWIEHFHLDGLRVDAVACHIDYGRKAGEWIANRHGGNENLEGRIDFLRMLNQAVYRDHPDTQVIAEESTSWPAVSRPVYVGGLGFGLKWNMGWMHDTLNYLHESPIYRKYHHGELTFSIWYRVFREFHVAAVA